jgi:peptide/nickel transport system substrate-binding protein
MLTRRFGMLFLSILILVLAVSGIQAQANVLRVGMLEPVNLDPASGSNDPEVLFSRQIYEYLLDLNPAGELVPQLATDYTVSDDGLTYTFNLVENATFHDGSAFTSEDVVFTFDRLASIGSPALAQLGQAETGTNADGTPTMSPTWTIAADGDFTVVFTLEAPNADFLYGVASRFAMILPSGLEAPNSLAADGGLAFFNGTGPFQLDSYSPGEGAVLVANEAYRGGRPALDSIEFVFIEDATAQVNALLNNEVDFIFKLSNDVLPLLDGNADVTVANVATNIHPVIRLRSDAGHIGEDVRVRQAFKHATDRELLNIDALNGTGTVGNNDPFGPVYGSFYNPVEPLSYDPQAACDLLAEYAAENPDNPWVTMDGDTPNLTADFYVVEAFEYPLLAEFLQQQWAEACINVNLLVRPEGIYYGSENEWMEVDLGLTGWSSYPTAQSYLTLAYVSGGPYNESHWSNARIDELAAQSLLTTNVDERAALFAEMSQIFEQEGPVIIPYFRPVVGAYRNTVQGLEMHPFPGSTNFAAVSVSE